LAFAKGFHLGAAECQASLISLQQMIVVPSRAVLRDDLLGRLIMFSARLLRGLTGGFGRGFRHGTLSGAQTIDSRCAGTCPDFRASDGSASNCYGFLENPIFQ